MPIPAIRGTIDRRILVNYHVDPNVLSAIFRRPFARKLERYKKSRERLSDPWRLESHAPTRE
jgi:hypothetical protein